MYLRISDPFREFVSLQEEVGRAFGKALGLKEERCDWVPPVDVYEGDDAVTVRVDVPGVAIDQVSVTVEEGRLEVSGERKLEPEADKTGVRRQERGYGSFHRTMLLPENVDGDQASASLDNGVLNVVLPKETPARPREVKVDVKEEKK